MTVSQEMIALADKIAVTPLPGGALIARERRMIEDALRTVALIDAIRADEGNSVEIVCPNPDFNGQPDQAIDVRAFWGGKEWGERRFAGDTVLDCLSAAHAAMTSSDGRTDEAMGRDAGAASGSGNASTTDAASEAGVGSARSSPSETFATAAHVDLETVQTLLDLLNPMHGELDRQLYDDRMRTEYEVPRERDWGVRITEGMERDLTQAVLILEDRKERFATPAARWRHLKRGTVYVEHGRGQLQSNNKTVDEEPIVIYRGTDGQWWARPVSEFEDGRFERVQP